MKSHEIFACLKPGYKAVSLHDSKIEVFINKEGLYYLTDDFGVAHKFKPENFRGAFWEIQSLPERN